jgi:alginate O-acetyltransferase complex protein AlgJ
MPSDHVLEGLDGWLFLGEGTNYSISQMTGVKPVATEVQSKWIKTILMRNVALKERVLTVICPEKSCIYRDKLPRDVKIDPGRFSQILCRRWDHTLYALGSILPENSEHLLYSKTDTHFTDFGAFKAAQEILSRFGLQPLDPPAEWISIPIIGDLGVVLNPRHSSENTIAKNPPPMQVIDNGLRNRGRVTIYRAPEASGPRILIFGDSFSGINLARWIAYSASEVTFIHSGAFDYGVIQRINPDFVIGEHAERFLIDPSEEGRSLFSLILEKKIQNLYSAEMLDKFRNSYDAFKHIYGAEMDMNIDTILS